MAGVTLELRVASRSSRKIRPHPRTLAEDNGSFASEIRARHHFPKTLVLSLPLFVLSAPMRGGIERSMRCLSYR